MPQARSLLFQRFRALTAAKSGIFNVYGNEKSLGKNVVVIGGGRGAETGLHLSQCGHKVTVLASGKQLVPAEGPHQGIHFGVTDTFSYILQATTTGISNGNVTYQDAKGKKSLFRRIALLSLEALNRGRLKQ